MAILYTEPSERDSAAKTTAMFMNSVSDLVKQIENPNVKTIVHYSTPHPESALVDTDAPVYVAPMNKIVLDYLYG